MSDNVQRIEYPWEDAVNARDDAEWEKFCRREKIADIINKALGILALVVIIVGSLYEIFFG